MHQICTELESVKFATIMIDTSNHKNSNVVPILIVYFNQKTEGQIQFLEINLKSETPDILRNSIIEI